MCHRDGSRRSWALTGPHGYTAPALHRRTQTTSEQPSDDCRLLRSRGTGSVATSPRSPDRASLRPPTDSRCPESTTAVGRVNSTMDNVATGR
ncbi:hypothetical protein KM043_009426 [Ampulex compressa]|nr:hypothetical protein KM043_009426 [Ampulex compressa]